MIERIIVQLAAVPFTPNDIKAPEVGLDSGLQVILNTLFSVIAVVSIVAIIVGAAKYVVSGGDSAGVKSAKETIMYAVVGLVIALLAFGIVNFITTQAGNVAK